MLIRSAVGAAAFAVLLTSTSAIAQETKSPRLQARLPRAIVDLNADGPPSPLITTVGESFFGSARTPRLIGNQPNPNKKVIRSFEALGDYDTRLLGRALVPPDTMGAVGTTQFVQIINGAFAVFDKNNGKLLGATSDNGFWNQLGQTGTGGDPRILFNHQMQRWIAIGFGNDIKDINIGVSDTADALGNWKATKFEGLARVAPGLQTIADYPTLAMDNNAIYIGTNNFRQETPGGPTAYRGTSLFVLNKDDIFAASGPSVANIKEFNTPFVSGGINDVTRGFAIQGVNSNESDADGKGHIVAASAFVNGVLAYDINNAGTAAATQSASTFLYGGYASNAPGRQPGRPDATNPGPLRNIDTLDDRIATNAWELNGKTYFVHTVTVPGTDRTSVRVAVIDSNTKAVLQTLDLGEAGYDFYQGSIAVSETGRAMIGYNRSGTDAADGKIRFYAQAFNIAPNGTLVAKDGAILLKESITPGYLNGNPEITGTPNGRQRWGDYSAVTLDPTDGNLFWAIGQFAQEPYETARPGHANPASGFSRWGQWVAAISAVPEPATWAQMIAGFAFVGGMARASRRREAMRTQTA
jgi:hypothetical protein